MGSWRPWQMMAVVGRTLKYWTMSSLTSRLSRVASLLAPTPSTLRAISVIRGNYIHAPCPFYGIHATSEHGGVHTNVIENNRVVGCDQAGIYSQGRDTVIRNNLSENNCIGVYLSSAPTLVANNTIFGTHTAPLCSDAYGIFDKSSGSTLVNNLILQQHMYVYSMNTQPTMATNLCDAPGCQLQASASAVSRMISHS